MSRSANRWYVVPIILFIACITGNTAAQDESSYTVAVLDLEPNGVSQVEARGLSEKLNSHIAGLAHEADRSGDRYEVIERSQIDKIFEQFEIQNFACSSDSCAVEFGKMLQADRIVIGSISLIGETYSVIARMVDVESGRTIRSADRQFHGSIDVVLVEVIPNIGTELITGERIYTRTEGIIRTGSEDGLMEEEHYGIRLIPIPAGMFRMGDENGERDERPVHAVTLDAFLMSETEITQEQYLTVTGKSPADFKGDGSLPVEDIRWNEAAAFCNKLSEMAGLDTCYDPETWTCNISRNGFRLPTEAEWEYASRAGTTTSYSSGNSKDDLISIAWYCENSDDMTHPVASLGPNEWGLYDMHGNVREWVQGWYGRYEQSGVRNPLGPESGSYYVFRGGSWKDDPEDCRSARRYYVSARDRSNTIGFRIVRNPANPPAPPKPEPVGRSGNRRS